MLAYTGQLINPEEVNMSVQIGIFMDSIIEPVEFNIMNSIMDKMDTMEDRIENCVTGDGDLELAEIENEGERAFIYKTLLTLSPNYREECLLYADTLNYNSRGFFLKL